MLNNSSINKYLMTQQKNPNKSVLYMFYRKIHFKMARGDKNLSKQSKIQHLFKNIASVVKIDSAKK